MRDLRRDQDQRDVPQTLDFAQPLDNRKLIDQDRVKVSGLGVAKRARLLERSDDRDLEPELFDRLDDAGVVVQGVDQENPAAGVRDERLLTDLLERPFADGTLDGEEELRAAAKLRRHPHLAAHQLDEPLRDGQAETGPAVLAGRRAVCLSLSGLMPMPVSEMQNSSWYVLPSRSAEPRRQDRATCPR